MCRFYRILLNKPNENYPLIFSLNPVPLSAEPARKTEGGFWYAIMVNILLTDQV